MAGLAPAAAGPDARSVARWLVRSMGMGLGRCVAVVLGSGARSHRRLLPPPKPRLSRLAEGRRPVAQPPDLAWRSAADRSRPGSVALAPGRNSQPVRLGLGRRVILGRPGSPAFDTAKAIVISTHSDLALILWDESD